MDKQRFGELVIGAELSLYRVAKSILYDDNDCADAIGEAVTRAFEKLHTLKQDEFAKTWLIRILINECYKLKRYSQRVMTVVEDEEFEPVLQGKADYSELYEAIGRLSSKNRLVIVLYYLEGYSVREIAKMLRIGESAVKNRMSRARKELKEYLKEDGELWINVI